LGLDTRTLRVPVLAFADSYLPGVTVSLKAAQSTYKAHGADAQEAARGSYFACVPCMRSCLGVQVPRPGMRGAEGQGKRQGVTVRWGLKAAWNARAGRGTRTGYEVWYSRGELARHSKALPPRLGCA
jgi:hypothetical protein